MMTKDQAIDKLMHSTQADLAEWVYYSHKDFYGTKGRHWLSASIPELVNWIICHFQFDETTQCWNNIIPFDYELGE